MIPGIVAAGASEGAGPPPTDPNFADVKLLLHFDGANGGTTFTDSSSVGRTPTVSGNAQTSNAQFKFGSASGLFDGSGDWIQYVDHADWYWGSGDGTAEMWLRPDSNVPATRNLIFGQLNSAGGQGALTLALTTGGVWQAIIWNGTGFQSILSSSVPSATWQHVAICKQGTTLRFYVDGVQQGSVAIGNAGQIANAPDVFTIGRGGAYNADYYSGYIDDFRWTKGVARYPNGTTFTPPSAAFPNS